jgi:hypothetical protein
MSVVVHPERGTSWKGIALVCGPPGAAQPVAVQPVPDGVPVDAQLAIGFVSIANRKR